MLQHCQCLRTLSNFSSLQKIHCNLIRRFCNKTQDDDPSKSIEETQVSKLLDDAATFSEITNTEWATTPYPASAHNPEDSKPKRQIIDPKDTSVILFPGQGIIKVGNVREYTKFPRVKELFEIANEILGYDLYKICLKGPQKVLNETEFNQPATVVMSLAALEKLQEERPKAIEQCVATAGYSIGELTALIFSGAVPYEEGLKLVGVRAAAMQAASEMSKQGMLSCFCTSKANAYEICKEAEKWAMDIGAVDPVCRIAIYLHTQGKIFGGSYEALEYIQKNSSNLGLKKVQLLPVSGAFHTSLMEPALKRFVKALEATPFDEPNVTVYSNYAVKIYNNNEKLTRKFLKKQIVSPVKWEQTMQKLYLRPEGSRFPRTFDVGSGGTMKTLLKQINAKAADHCYSY